MTDTNELDVLRAELKVAEKALNDLPEDATPRIRKAAEAKKAAAEKALGDAHVRAQAAEAKRSAETRPVKPAVPEVRDEPKPEPEVKPLSLYDLTAGASTQTVRGTEDLTPEQQAARRNPKHT